MKPKRNHSQWLWFIFFCAVFLAFIAFLCFRLEGRELIIALPVLLITFSLYFLLFFTDAHRALAGKNRWIGVLLVLLIQAPSLILSFWLGLGNAGALGGLVWFPPFLGVAIGMNLRLALGKVK